MVGAGVRFYPLLIPRPYIIWIRNLAHLTLSNLPISSQIMMKLNRDTLGVKRSFQIGRKKDDVSVIEMS